MREFKFRGKRIDNGQWVYGHYFQTPLTDENSGAPQEAGWYFLCDEKRHCIEQDGVAYVIDPDTVGQYIRINDRDGREIYEGDRWGTSCPDGKDPDGGECDKWDFDDWETQIVIWNDRGHYFSGLPDYDDYNSVFNPRFIKVLDNIYDNPELLNNLKNY